MQRICIFPIFPERSENTRTMPSEKRNKRAYLSLYFRLFTMTSPEDSEKQEKKIKGSDFQRLLSAIICTFEHNLSSSSIFLGFMKVF